MFMREVLKLQTPKHILKWIELLLKHKDQLAVEAARDHAKSWTFSYVYPLWRVYQVKKLVYAPVHIALVSYSEEQAMKNVKRIRDALAKPVRWLKKRFSRDTVRHMRSLADDADVQALID